MKKVNFKILFPLTLFILLLLPKPAFAQTKMDIFPDAGGYSFIVYVDPEDVPNEHLLAGETMAVEIEGVGEVFRISNQDVVNNNYVLRFRVTGSIDGDREINVKSRLCWLPNLITGGCLVALSDQTVVSYVENFDALNAGSDGGSNPDLPPGPISPGPSGSTPGVKHIRERDVSNLVLFFQSAQYYAIAVGVLISLFMIPYIGILLASGDPENVEKGMDWLRSFLGGLLLLVFSGLIIRIFGTDFLGF